MSLKSYIAFFSFYILFINCTDKEIVPELDNNQPLGEFIDDFTYRIFPKPTDNFDIAEFKLWIPDNTDNLKAVLVLIPHYNGNGLSLVNISKWQEFARQENLVLCGVKFQVQNNLKDYSEASLGSGKALMNAVEKIAVKNNHSSISSLPFLMRGYSAGGVFSYNFSAYKPELVVGFVNIRGWSLESTSSVNKHIPGLTLIGQLEGRNEYVRNLILNKRSEGGLWSFAIEPGANHFYDLTASDNLAIDFFTSIINKRISDHSNELIMISENSGWLGNLSLNIVSQYEDYMEDRSNAFWLTDETFANKWLDFQQN